MALRHVSPSVLLVFFLCPLGVSAQQASLETRPHTGPVITDITAIDHETFEAIATKLPQGRAPKIDGTLNDQEWALAPAQGRFIQREPQFGWESTERTEFRILYDDKKLYLGIWAFDSDPSGIIASELKRDSGLRKGDQIKITLDTFHDHRNAFYFSTNPLGALKDANSVEEGRTINYDWNAVWENKTTIDEQGWYVEIAIPLSQLRFKGGPGETVWGINLCRIIIRKNEETYWVPYPREWQAIGFARMSGAGVLKGLADLKPRRRLEFVPFAAPQVSRNFDAGTPTQTSKDYGFDLKVGLSQSLNADFTFKTDFAQVEADQEVVNLSRFSLFFPEKRQFFTEGAGTFDYSQNAGATAGPGLLTLFYSRRVGLQDGRPVPILAGGRVTGRVGHTTLGLMNIETDETSLVSSTGTSTVIPRANHTVVRVKRDVFASSSIGGIVLSRTGGGRPGNRTIGIDGVFTLGKHLDWIVLAAKTFTPGESGRDWAGVTKAKWTTERFEAGVTYVDIAERFNAEMGFIPRTDIRNTVAQAAWTPRPKWKGVRQLRFNVDTSYFENHAGRKESQNTGVDVRVSRQDSSIASVSLDKQYDFLPFDWSTAGGFIPSAGYTWRTFKGSFTSNQAKPVYGSVGTDIGGYYNGDKQTVRLSLNVAPKDTLLFENSYTRNRIVLPETGPYVTNVVSTRVSYSFSPGLFVKTFVQYNDASHTASVNLLLWYIYRPGSDFYVVYNQGWETDLPGPRDLRVRGRSLAVKMTYWLSR
ncbi:MAG: carbohydrate binding family 9 domain-containing protein [Acidobacteria bacterium]|nr:carbohydrate binding family 9 domain-containing protein [Acidobacteriota bacterium]